VTRTEHSLPSNLESLLGFDVLSFADAFSSSHANLFGGSWVRCLDGLRFVPSLQTWMQRTGGASQIKDANGRLEAKGA